MIHIGEFFIHHLSQVTTGEMHMSGQELRREYMKKFRTLSRPKRAQAFAYLASYVLQIMISIALGTHLLLDNPGILACFAIGLLMLFVGTRFRGINNIVHECSHFAFSQERSDNMLLGKLSSAFLLKSFDAYRKEHMTHHAHLGDYDKDLDFQNIRDFGLEQPLTPAAIARHVVTPLVGLHLPHYLGVSLSVKDGFGYALLKVALLAGAAAFTFINPLAAILMLIIPFAWIYSALNFWTDVVDHGGLLETGDELHASRNLLVPRPIRAILFPRNDCYHLIHHLFPNIPVQHFDRVHEELMENPAYREKTVKGSPPVDPTPAANQAA